MNEFRWIDTHFLPLTNGQHSVLSLKDDAALLCIPSGKQLVVTTDSLNENIHFLPNTSAHLIAQKALAVNLSDLAAMGATPHCYQLALSLPKETDEAWIADFCTGLRTIQDAYHLFLSGGDSTATTGALNITITAFGLVNEGKALTRSGAQTGDHLYVTGTIGDAYLGLQVSQQTSPENQHLRTRYERPTPRCEIGSSLTNIATACIDISDGLAQDISHLCHASNVGATIQADHIPLSKAAQNIRPALPELLSGGDDYELLFTAPASAQEALNTLAEQHQTPITAIGSITDDKTVTFLDSHQQPLTFSHTGYQHF